MTKGNVATKLTTYKPVEGRDYDYYLVDVDMTVNRSGSTTEYKANRVGRTNHLSTQRWVKVPEGQKPRFKLRLELPKDTCTNYRESRCTSYTNGSVATTYYVGTKL